MPMVEGQGARELLQVHRADLVLEVARRKEQAILATMESPKISVRMKRTTKTNFNLEQQTELLYHFGTN